MFKRQVRINAIEVLYDRIPRFSLLIPVSARKTFHPYRDSFSQGHESGDTNRFVELWAITSLPFCSRHRSFHPIVLTDVPESTRRGGGRLREIFVTLKSRKYFRAGSCLVGIRIDPAYLR